MVPGFLMATLNPGRTRSRRRGKTRRKLTAWQRLVKKAGGVMQALKLRRAGRKSKGRKRRRNPFLSTSPAAVAPLMNAGRRRRKKNRTRRSAVSRRRLRSRSRKTLGRRPKMAKVRSRRRRRVLRGKGGRFTRRRSRRTRRNPVVPVSWNPRRKRRRSRARRNPLFLSKRGFSGRKHKGYRQLHRRRRRPHFWHNPVVPISWNPGRRRRGGRRRHYRNNPVLPYFAMNPGNAVSEVLGKLKSMVDVSFWTETGLPVTVGFFGAKIVGGQIMNYIPASILSYVPAQATPFVKATVNTLAGAALSWGASKFVSKKAGDNVWLGTIVGVSADLIKTLLDTFAPGFSSSIGLSGLGSSLDDRMKDAITQRVRNNLNGYLTVRNVRDNVARPVNGLGATYVTVKRGGNTYDPSPRLAMAGDIADDSTQL